MRISILTLFPEIFDGPLSVSIIKRAIAKKRVTIKILNIRDYALDRHKSVDDRPFGGGQGMILKVDVVHRSITDAIKISKIERDETRIILLDPKGTVYTQKKALELSEKFKHIIFICAHYEGIDDRIRNYIDEMISIGDYVLTGGEIPAMVLSDSIIRLLPGVLKKPEATHDESFTHPNVLEYPQYTRPVSYEGISVPTLIREGDHKKIEKWKKECALSITSKLRPDLMKKDS